MYKNIFIVLALPGKRTYSPILSLLNAVVYNVIRSGKIIKYGKQRFLANISLVCLQYCLGT